MGCDPRVRGAVREGENVTPEEIVRNLADFDPMVDDGFSGRWCPLCPPGWQPQPGEVHEPSCLHRQAVEWVAANPPSEEKA